MNKNVGSPLVATDNNYNAGQNGCISTVATSGAATLYDGSTEAKPNRKYPRANFHDYNGGSYFVTVCTKDKEHFFGTIYDEKMHLSQIGKELNAQLTKISSHYNDVEIPLFVIMPNHFHAIIHVGSPLVANEPKIAENLGRLNGLARLTVATSGDPTLSTHHGCRLGNIISAIKAGVTRFARRNNIEFGWQARYHDHIIRGTFDGNRIAEYIENNVARWANDCYYE